MKKVLLIGSTVLALIMSIGLVACSQAIEAAAPTPAGALSVEELLANLDTLQGSGSKSMTFPGQSVFALPGGGVLSSQNLSAYLNSIKRDFANFVYGRTSGKPYLVLPVRLSWVSEGKRESGLMWVPFTWGRRLDAPVITYLHGTQVYRQCAPSRFNANPLAVLSSADQIGALQAYVEGVVGALMASSGYIVVMPDYPGFGDSAALHPYVHQSLGNSARDALSAAKAALPGQIRPNGKIYITGYSEGGYATLAAARSFQQAGIQVSGIVPCDGAYDLSGTMLSQMLSGLPVKVPSYLLYVSSGYKAVYGPLLDYHGFLRPSYADLLTTDNPFDGNHTNAQINALGLPAVPTDMLLGSPGNPPASLVPGGMVFNLLAANNGYVGWVPTAPLVFIHCPADDIVPYANAVVARTVIQAAAQAYLGPLYDPRMIPEIIDVAPVSFIQSALGETHIAAYPTAILAAFSAIETIDGSLP